LTQIQVIYSGLTLSDPSGFAENWSGFQSLPGLCQFHKYLVFEAPQKVLICKIRYFSS